MQSEEDHKNLYITDFVSGEIPWKQVRKEIRTQDDLEAHALQMSHEFHIRDRLKRVRSIGCPEALRQKIESSVFKPAETRSETKTRFIRITQFQWLASAAAILLAAWFGYQFGVAQPSVASPQVAEVEHTVGMHFISNTEFSNQMVPLAFTKDAAGEFLSQQNWQLTIPPVQNASFAGLYSYPIQEGRNAHVFKYELEDGQPLYVFAFHVPKVESFMHRDDSAIAYCKSDDDYYIKNVVGKHVVSWKWSDNWYSAISNHDGSTIAALLPKK